jgi:hypothetical protein
MKDDLQEDVAEFFGEFVIVVGLDGVEQFVDFFHCMPAQGKMVLLAVPGTAAGRSQARHDAKQILDGAVLHRVSLACSATQASNS